jgi:multimeric flavodoxin WrbA
MGEVIEIIRHASLIVICTPVYTNTVPGGLKLLIDRCQALWARRYVLKQNPPDSARKGVFIGVGATKGKQLFDGSILTMKYFFHFEKQGTSWASE